MTLMHQKYFISIKKSKKHETVVSREDLFISNMLFPLYFHSEQSQVLLMSVNPRPDIGLSRNCFLPRDKSTTVAPPMNWLVNYKSVSNHHLNKGLAEERRNARLVGI